jgi:predicted Zn-dependent peptidase
MEIWTLSNGIKVLFKKTDGLKIVSLNIFSRGGALCEDAKKNGISNLTPKSMTRATMNRSVERMALDIADLGASFEASGDYDYAGFGLDLLSEKFVKAVEIVSDILINPSFNQEEIEKDINAACASITSKKESIRALASDYFIEHFYKDDAYSRNLSGTIETMTSIKREDLIAWHKAAYSASNIMISVVGNVDPELARESFEKYFAIIPVGEKLKRHPISQPNEGGIHYFDEQFDQAYIAIGYPAPNLFSPNVMNIKILSLYLGGRMTSKLFVELREKMGLAYELGTIYPMRLERSFFGIYIGLDNKKVDIALKRIDEILKEICLKELTQYEIDNVKNYAKGIHVLNSQTVKSLSFQYGIGEFIHNDYRYYEKYIDNIMKPTSKDILDAANEMFNHTPTAVILRPKQKR